MSRFERLLIPIIALVIIAALLLEEAGASAVRIVALSFGVLLCVALVIGMVHRAKKKLRTAAALRADDQTSNDDGANSDG